MTPLVLYLDEQAVPLLPGPNHPLQPFPTPREVQVHCLSVSFLQLPEYVPRGEPEAVPHRHRSPSACDCHRNHAKLLSLSPPLGLSASHESSTYKAGCTDCAHRRGRFGWHCSSWRDMTPSTATVCKKLRNSPKSARRAVFALRSSVFGLRWSMVNGKSRYPGVKPARQSGRDARATAFTPTAFTQASLSTSGNLRLRAHRRGVFRLTLFGPTRRNPFPRQDQKEMRLIFGGPRPPRGGPRPPREDTAETAVVPRLLTPEGIVRHVRCGTAALGRGIAG